MKTKTAFKDISQGGSRNIQKITHNHAPTDAFMEMLCNTIKEMQETIRTLIKEKLRLYNELSKTKARLQRLELEQERMRFPLLNAHYMKEVANRKDSIIN